MPLEISHLETVQSLISSNSCYLIHKKTSAYLQKFPGYQLAVASASCSLSFHHQLGETLKESRNPCSLHPRAIVWKIESFIDIKFLSKEWDYTKRNRLSWKLVWPQVHLRARAGPVKVKFWHATRHWDSNMDINKMTTNNLTCVEILTVMWGASKIVTWKIHRGNTWPSLHPLNRVSLNNKLHQFPLLPLLSGNTQLQV